MPKLPPSSVYLQKPQNPVSEGERESLNLRLSTEFSEGRIDHETYERLLDQLFHAKTLGDLVPVIEAVPAPSVATPPAVIQYTRTDPGELQPARKIPDEMMKLFMIVGGSAAMMVLIVLFVFALSLIP